MSKATTWTLRAAGLLLPLLCAAAADAMPSGGYCTQIPTERQVWGAYYTGQNATTCFYSCTVTDHWAWECWSPDRDPYPIPYAASAPADAAASGVESFTADSGALSCSFTVVPNGETSDTYSIPKEKSKGDGSSDCDQPYTDPGICCDDWYGWCQTGITY